MLCVSARVRVKRSVSNPTHGLGSVAHDKVGIVKRVDPDGDLKVDFPEHSGWTGKSSEMEVVTARSDRPTTNAVILIEAGSERSGSLGLIIQDDHDETPFKVRFKDGETKCYKESQVQYIGEYDEQYPVSIMAGSGMSAARRLEARTPVTEPGGQYLYGFRQNDRSSLTLRGMKDAIQYYLEPFFSMQSSNSPVHHFSAPVSLGLCDMVQTLPV